MLKIIASSLSFFFFISLFFSASSVFAVSNNILFADSFDDGNFSDWTLGENEDDYWQIGTVEGSYMLGQ